MNFPFDAEKAAEATMFFLSRERTEPTVLKLLKLLYLAERTSIERREVPIFGGRYFSMKHGPVPSDAYTLMDGQGMEVDQKVWDELIAERDVNTLRIRNWREPITLSVSEIRILEEVHAQHADKSAS